MLTPNVLLIVSNKYPKSPPPGLHTRGRPTSLHRAPQRLAGLSTRVGSVSTWASAALRILCNQRDPSPLLPSRELLLQIQIVVEAVLFRTTLPFTSLNSPIWFVWLELIQGRASCVPT